MSFIPWLVNGYLLLGVLLVSLAYSLYTSEQRTLENEALDRSYKMFVELFGEGFLVKPVYKFWMYFFTVVLWLPLMLIKN
jgi:hypothetical protein